jgi:hypothetical protein
MSLRVRVQLPGGAFTPTEDIFDRTELWITCDHCYEPLESPNDCLVWLAPDAWNDGTEPHTVHAGCVPDFVMETYLPVNHANVRAKRVGEHLLHLVSLMDGKGSGETSFAESRGRRGNHA